MGTRIFATVLPVILMVTLTLPWIGISTISIVFPSVKRRILNPAPPKKPVSV